VIHLNKVQLAVLWLAGLAVSGILCSTGLKLLDHAATNKELLSTGYPFTVLAGTAWGYVAPIIIVGVLLGVSFKGHGKK
jgi:hypothetical protein